MANIVSSQPVYNQDSSSNPFAGTPRLPGETDAQYQARLYNAGADANTINKLIQTETNTSQTALDQQAAMRKQNLSDLATLLAGQNKETFNADIPGIANSAAKSGMLETSGFGQALGQDYTNLQRQTDQALAQQGIANSEAGVAGVGTIADNSNALNTAGAQRTFSTNDQDKANQLALQLGQMSVPAQPQQPSTTDKIIGSAGPILSGVGAVKGAAGTATKAQPNSDIWSSIGG